VFGGIISNVEILHRFVIAANRQTVFKYAEVAIERLIIGSEQPCFQR
jgi:hypothetical protein